MVGGIFLFKDNYYFNHKFLALEWNWIRTKIEYASYRGEYKNLFFGKFEKALSNNQNATESVPVLLYHGIIDDSNWQPDGVNISLRQFKEQMFALKKAGYQTITLKDFYSFINEEKKLPEKSLLITFDDGRSDSFYPSDPIFRALDFNAVMFVITGRSLGLENEKSTFHLSRLELERMKESGRWEFGSHTKNGHELEKIDLNGTLGHFLSDKLWIDEENRLETNEEFVSRIEKDLAASKDDLKNGLGISAIAIAYPFGDYGHNTQNNPESQKILKNIVENIFSLSFCQSGDNEFPTNYPGKNYKLVKRINTNSDLSAEKLVSILNESQNKKLPYSDSFFKNRGWITAWGSSNFKNGLFLNSASDRENSSLAFLNGTFTWIDYSMQARARLIKGDSFSIIARYINGNNYASCDFSNNEVSLTERLEGQEKIISEVKTPIIFSSHSDISIKMEAKGNRISCGIGEKVFVSGNISQELGHGGIGFKTWNNSANNSDLLISYLNVK